MIHSKKMKFAVTTAAATAIVCTGALAANVTSTTDVNVRSGAGNSYSVLTVMKSGTTTASLGNSGKWTKVNVNGKTGYVSSKYLTTSKPSTSQPTTSQPSNSGSKKLVGNFKLTFYAGYSTTASGRTPRVNHTIAADTSVLPMYTKVYIEGWGTYTVEDRGGAIKGKRIDIFVANNSIARKNGVKYANVYIVK